MIIELFHSFQREYKERKTSLTKWIKDTYGDTFKQLVITEDIVKIKEKLFEEHPSAENMQVLQSTQAELKRYFTLKKFPDLTRLFHIIVKRRRKKLQLHRIRNN